MNIYANNGHKVIVTEETKNSGHDYDKEKVKKYLNVGEEYTVNYTDVGGWSTRVYLEEIEDVEFNSVNFEDVSEQSEEDDENHPQWRYYN